MSKKFGKILSFVLALVMVCSLLPMSVMAAENDTYTVTFAPGTLCHYTGEGEYPTSTYDGTDEFLLPRPADLGLVGSLDNIVFRGWTLEGGDGTIYEVGDDVANLITGNVTFLANYVAEVILAPGALCEYTGEGTYPMYTYDGTGEILLPDPAEVHLVARENNCEFSGWSLEGGDGTLYASGTNVTHLITGNMTFLANYITTATPGTIIYTVDPGTLRNTTTNLPQRNGPIPEQYVTEISLPVTNEGITNEYRWVIPEGTTFARWEKNGGETIPVDGERTISFKPEDGDVYTAIWESTTVTTYTVTLHPGTAGGETVPGEPVLDGSFAFGTEYYGPAENPFTKEGYHSIGWSYTDGGALVTFPIEITENVDLYAVWESDKEDHYWTVTFNAGDGAAFRTEVTGFTYDEGVLTYEALMGQDFNAVTPNVNLLTANGENAVFTTMPPNMEFAGWKEDGTESPVLYSGQNFTVTEDTTLTAQWREKGIGPYVITYNAGTMSGVVINDEYYTNADKFISYEAGAAVTLPTMEQMASVLDWHIPSNSNFLGWADVNDNDHMINAVEVISSDMTLVAIWGEPTAHTWTVTFDANGGTGTMEPVPLETENDSYIYIAPECEFTAPNGMEFDYWTMAGSDTPIYVGDVIEVNSDITLVAHWRQAEYFFLVTFEANGGTGEMAPLFLQSTTGFVRFTIPECTFTAPEGKKFNNWADQNGTIYDPGQLIILRSDMTLTAQWVEETTSNFTKG